MAGKRKQSNEETPTTDGFETWNAYWTAQGMPWRTEPEISVKRQGYLTTRRAVEPEFEKGIYPFQDENGSIALTRADVEWLLATHERGGIQGPVDIKDERHKNRWGIDLRGADLHGVNLDGLPLARLIAANSVWDAASKLFKVSGHMEGVSLRKAHLEGATLEGAFLEGADLRSAFLQDALLDSAHLEKTIVEEAHLEGAFLMGADLAGADLMLAHLENTTLIRANLAGKEMESEDLARVRQYLPRFPDTLRGANLFGCYFDQETTLEDAMLGNKPFGSVFVGSIRWGGVDLTGVDWTQVDTLGETQEACESTWEDAATHMHKRKPADGLRTEYSEAVRANRQLATVLRSQGLNEDADRFAYHAQVLQRQVWRWSRSWGRWLFSCVLAAVAGYGYRLECILIVYGLTVATFAAAYLALGVPVSPHTTPGQAVLDALQVSVTAIHGRVFFEQFGLGSTLAWATALESVLGIVIEGVFTAMLVQRFFGSR